MRKCWIWKIAKGIGQRRCTPDLVPDAGKDNLLRLYSNVRLAAVLQELFCCQEGSRCYNPSLPVLQDKELALITY